MDSKRFPDPESLDLFYRTLSSKLSKLDPYDILITGDDNALSFAIERQQEFFPQLPIVFMGVNNVAKAMEQNNNRFITGVIETVSMQETLELITRLHPETKRILALVDDTPSGQGDLITFHSYEISFAPVVLSELSLTNLTFDELATQLKRLGDGDVVLLLSAYKDKNNKSLLFHESLQLIRANLSRPLYHFWFHGMGNGVLGGKVVSHDQQGKAAANIALDILDGRQPEDIPVTSESPNVYIFDYNEMQRFNLAPSTLPQGSIILNQPYSYYQEHKKLIWSCLGIFSGYSILVCILLINIRHRKTAQEALRASEEKFRLLLDSTAEAIYGVDTEGDCIFCNPACLSLLGYKSEAVILGENMHTLMHHHRKDGTEYPENECLICQVCVDGKGVRVDSEVFWRTDGSTFDAEYTSFPIRKGNELVGAVVAFHDISERKRVEEALIEAKKVAEETSQLKSEFLAKISHEIRTPMTVFLSAIEHLIDLDKDPEHQRILELADLSSRRLHTLVEGILDFSKLEDRNLELDERTVVLRNSLEETLKLMQEKARQKGLRIDLKIDANVPEEITCDDYRLSQILLNLISNAIKFTEIGSVQLTVSQNDNNLVFEVRDTGIGIPEEKYETIFEDFKQADNSITRKYGGAGLGLAIARGLVELMGGQISVQSQLDQGSAFTFNIPRKTAAQG